MNFEKIEKYSGLAFKVVLAVIGTTWALGQMTQRSTTQLTSLQNDVRYLQTQQNDTVKRTELNERSILLIQQGFSTMNDTLREIKDELKEQRKK